MFLSWVPDAAPTRLALVSRLGGLGLDTIKMQWFGASHRGNCAEKGV
jgi:hypothetical protein